ncbi:sodium:dicarboxylate symporter [Novosphingobium aromaticivorans DSM 12444]|uniref:Sodium:dicarboxylate symporter n=1 Tax=Novosphingobium aromaticivorans (strain ATCC 700278 / DSM 12444 / CCUG 56034 / CIP 105152 / NBRC 16084 / F199) TaxID=279238 RepID=Q2GCF3_NOVAD|nr:dicarboxylate/amino acid:cation symporter [Novosphingobium aromaticivorans]ABD24457.1 sodium:dicarboxylate symporter [Novosphingobium aromaticivorans DSM 12444]SCY27594.1 Na+/H+-dicarboxylate symporter [Novosphingobium aromaticivorans]
MARRLTLYILIGMLLGIVVGYALNTAYPKGDETLAYTADTLKLLPDVFLRLIKMIVAPLVLATIVTGIASMGDSAALGRIGGRSLAWFITFSFVSISLGLLLVNLLRPGVGLELTPTGELGELATGDFTFRHFVLSVFPASPIEAMAKNDILQVLVFSLFAGIALSAVGEKGAPLVRGAEALAQVMLTVTGYVMRFAPFAVFGAISSVIAVRGLGIIVTYGKLVGSFYLAMLILWVVLLSAGAIFLRGRIFTLIRYIREPLLLAYSTASSEAALPKLFEQLDRFGIPRRISGFVLPLGYSFNLDGSMIYTSFAAIFIAQAYGIELPVTSQIVMLLTLMVTSKGIAGVPRASLVVIAATLNQFGLPVEGIALVLGVDHFLDMGRSATNVVGNAVATSVVTKWEGMLQPPLDPDAEPLHAPSHTAADGRAGLNLDPANYED